ncbi:MAG: hypothetical protein IJ836_03885 [Spirochaetales bacterium]|nr:hypothetical protein [Spirochaetales bacterium]
MKKIITLALVLLVCFSAFASRNSSVSFNAGYTYTHQNIYISSDTPNGAKFLDGKQSSELAYSFHAEVQADKFFDNNFGFQASAALDKYFRYNYMTGASTWMIQNGLAGTVEPHIELWNSSLDEFGWITTIAVGPAYRFVNNSRFQAQMALMLYWTHSNQNSGSKNSKVNKNTPIDRTDNYFGLMYELSGKYFVNRNVFINFGVEASAALLWNINMKLSAIGIDESLKAKDYDAHRFAASPFVGIGMSF